MKWKFHTTRAAELVGYIPQMLSENDPRPAKEQLHESYSYGGGWQPFYGFKLDTVTRALRYPGDPSMKPIASTTLREESIFVYPHAWVMILQQDGSFEVARMD